MEYTSMEMQDQFAHALIGDQGTFLDLGSAHPVVGNNSASLEAIGWTGVAFEEIAQLANAMNQHRNTPCFAVDVTIEQPFIGILEKHFPDKHINYISLDVDEASVKCLELLIDNGFTFDAMTFEHDAYLDGDKRKVPARKILHDAGYKLLFKDVKTCSKNFSSSGAVCRPICSHTDSEEWEWEDWWVGPNQFDTLEIAGESMAHQECVSRLRGMKGIV